MTLQKPVLRPSMIVRVVAVEAHYRSHDVTIFASLRFGRADLRVLRVREAADWVTGSLSGVVGPSTALVAAAKPSCIAGGTSIRRPVTSPAAKICGVDVRP